MNNIPPDDRPRLALGMELLTPHEQLSRSATIKDGPSPIARALTRWENEGGAVPADERSRKPDISAT